VLQGLDGDKPHARTVDRFANGRRIGDIILVALECLLVSSGWLMLPLWHIDAVGAGVFPLSALSLSEKAVFISFVHLFGIFLACEKDTEQVFRLGSARE